MPNLSAARESSCSAVWRHPLGCVLALGLGGLRPSGGRHHRGAGEAERPAGELPAKAVEANIARMDKMRNAKGHIPTAELWRELQVSTQKYDPVHRNADDLPKGKDVIVIIFKEYKIWAS